MKYALNKSKTLVDAATAPKDERPFKCPSCKKPVVLRQGMWNAPCFSHWPGEGSIACELFTAAASQRWGHRLNYHERRKSGINTGFVRLCVKGDSIFDYSLLIAIPPSDRNDWTGQISCTTAHGQYLISATTSGREMILPVAPEREYKFERQGDVPDEYWSYFEDIHVGISPEGTYFRYNSTRAAALHDGASLSWNERYWLLAEDGTLDIDHAPASLHVESAPTQKPWKIYSLGLPVESDVSELEKDAIEQWLRREVRAEPSSIYLVEPLPHHLREDGTFCFPQGTGKIYIQNSDKLEIAISDANGSLLEVCEASDDGLFAFAPIQDGITQIAAGGQVLMRIEVGPCQLFEPAAPTVQTSKGIFQLPLESSERAIREAREANETIMIRAPFKGFRSVIGLDNQPWPSPSNDWALDTSSLDSFTLRIRGAGAVQVDIDAQRIGDDAFDSLKPMATWLWSVAKVAPNYYSHGLNLHIRPDSPPWISRLSTCRWNTQYLPHLRYLASRLTELGATNV